ncbi:MAG: A/G-specific adenine glycosylase [Methylobacteriaceae bacterium]|nr:A/G-specific adenine glycosylase [Methylobacteriaceae bacterium]
MRPSQALAPPQSAAPDPQLLLAWYDRHKRDLPWRAPRGVRPDPYAVWLSEVMLQQTTVEAVKPYFGRFLARWPDVAALAAAPLHEVMQAWAGLGYYSRARNLHACAGRIVEHHAGRFPDSEAMLRTLPGIGPYTAAAVVAIAFDRPTAVVDGNVERVVTRLHAIAQPVPQARELIREAVERLMSRERPGDFAQGMMDLGSMVCTPQRPACILCPFATACRAHAAGTPEVFPRKASKGPRSRRAGAVFVVHRADRCVLVRTRPAKGLLGGMTEFPGTPWAADFDLRTASAFAPIIADYRRLPGEVEHVFTHFALTLAVFSASVRGDLAAPSGHRWVTEADLDREALPSLMRKVLAHARTGARAAPDQACL